ncbi:hypothetical protein [Desemzia sp. FAM 23989]|uniref:hypothetical protein n=1 Tax=Desemzia sp. FAM 23989 TaxID=3259523 RepID=UPI00388382D9
MGAYSEGKEILKDIIQLSKGISDMELKSKIYELQNQFYELNDENRELRDRLHQFENTQIIGNDLEYHNGVYTKGNDVYCAVCWDKDTKLVRARKVEKNASNGTTDFACDVCKNWRFSDIPFQEDYSGITK